ncbi:MAG: cytochrome c oxidase assembly protein [Alphaproteobacteria bacterium]
MSTVPPTLTRAPRNWRRDLKVALSAFAFGATMFGAAFAAVPLYDMFCRITGFGGTTMVATKPADRVIDHQVDVRFDANVAAGLPWRFEADTTSITVKAGETHTMTYKVTNTSDRVTSAIASYNVAPLSTGRFFNKLQCFCFTEQTLQPGETREFGVVFFVDPAIADDFEGRGVGSITLSYTFFRQNTPPRPVADASSPTAPRPN